MASGATGLQLPLGFPKCPRCSYLRAGTAALCAACAEQSLDLISDRACSVCAQIVNEAGRCPNWLCHDRDRVVQRIRAIAYLSGDLRQCIHRYKYDGKSGWALIFGRLLLGWLNEHLSANPPDLIIANPTFTKAGETGHTERVILAAEQEDLTKRWNFDVGPPTALVKTSETPKSAAHTADAKRAAARSLGDALSITAVKRLEGLRILVYDDVCTTGAQINAVADYLVRQGAAASVEAVVLARAPWHHSGE